MTGADLVIVGGGPAGMMAGLLFARAGVRTAVLERHADFLRDLRGDTVHPSTIDLIGELGLLDPFLQLPHDRIEDVGAVIGGQTWRIADFRHLPKPGQFIAMMPQWHFLDFLAEEARRFPAFALRTNTQAVSLIDEDSRIAGVRSTTGEAIPARLVILADGRGPALTREAGLPLRDLGAPLDVLWFRAPKPRTPDNRTQGYLADGAGSIASLDDVKLLAVSLNRLDRWHRPGLLAIGDAARAMSPVGGVGINLAVQDAVAAANILAGALGRHEPVDPLLARVQARRMPAVRIVQALQRAIHTRVIGAALAGSVERASLPIRLPATVPLLQRIPARVLGLGVRREHIRSPLARG